MFAGLQTLQCDGSMGRRRSRDYDGINLLVFKNRGQCSKRLDRWITVDALVADVRIANINASQGAEFMEIADEVFSPSTGADHADRWIGTNFHV